MVSVRKGNELRKKNKKQEEPRNDEMRSTLNHAKSSPRFKREKEGEASKGSVRNLSLFNQGGELRQKELFQEVCKT